MKFWNIGNTTIRNPDRIIDGLRILKDNFEGKTFDEPAHEQFMSLLMEKDVYEKGGTGWSKDTGGLGGRKWASASNQLGLAIAWKSNPPLRLTGIGNTLINDDISEQEVFLRQLLKLHLPSPIESGKGYEGFDVCPFRLTLRVIYAMHEKGLKGITKEEIGLFLITTLQNNHEHQTIDRIIEYRKQRDGIVGKAAKKKFYRETKRRIILELFSENLKRRYKALDKLVKLSRRNKEFLKTEEADKLIITIIGMGKGPRTQKALVLREKIISGIKDRSPINELVKHIDEMFLKVRGATPKDYADTTGRYFAKSGLLSISGDKLVLKETELPLIEEIIEEGYPEFNEDNYLVDFYSPEQPTLPLDDETFIKNGIYEMMKLRNKFANSLGEKEKSIPKLPKVIHKLKQLESEIKTEVTSLKEQLFYLDQPNQTGDILNFFEQIKDRSLFGGDAYLPAYYEWTIWRVFLAIDSIENPISLTRGFKIDEEMNPIHHAAGGNADMVFVYKEFVLVVEVTLNRGANQWAAEAEPVPRHVAKVVEKYPSTPVYGFFVAPVIDPNTAQQFFNQTYWVGTELHQLEILPFSTDQLIGLISKFAKEPFSVAELRDLLGEMIELKKDSSHGMQWKSTLDKHLAQWVRGYQVS